MRVVSATKIKISWMSEFSRWAGACGVLLCWSLASAALELSPQESIFLNQNPTIKLCVSADNYPIEGTRQGNLTGITRDYLALIRQRIKLKTHLITTHSRQNALQKLASGECDLITSFPVTETRHEGFQLTKAYISMPIVLVSASDSSLLHSLSKVISHKVTIVDRFDEQNQLSERYASYQFVQVNSIGEGLQQVVDGKAHSFAAPLAVVGNFLQQNYVPNVKISEHLEDSWGLALAHSNEATVLAGLMNKAIDDISESEKRIIENSWIRVNYHHETDHHLLIAVILIGGLFFFGLLYRHILLAKHAESLKKISQTDKLTGLYNRVKTDEALNYHINSFRRYGDIFSVILLDIDNFKKINDQFGHMTGDKTLVKLAAVLKASCRNTDIIGRWGGEEFLIICPRADLERTKQITEKLLTNIHSILLSHHSNDLESRSVSASFGVAEIAIEDTHHSLVLRADKALLEAKQNGKDQFVVATTNMKDSVLLETAVL